jgi:hypothetical protein
MTRLSLASLALALALPLSAAGCGAASTAEPEYPEHTPKSRADQLTQHRAALAALRKSPFSNDAAADLGKAEAWMGQAERLAAEDEEEAVDLLLSAIGGQLALVQSYYGRREAEAALERVRREYERRRASEANLAREIEELDTTELGE